MANNKEAVQQLEREGGDGEEVHGSERFAMIAKKDLPTPGNSWISGRSFEGVSANQLKEHLGIGSYRTAWYMVHRIRKAMVELFPTKLSGIVEVDETYIGGKSIRRGTARGIGKPPRPKKDMVIGMRERGGLACVSSTYRT